jgi:hypothetical protein
MGLALLLDRHYREGIPVFVGWWPRELLSQVRIHPRVLWTATPLLSGAVYLLLMWHLTGDALAHVRAAGTYASGWDVKNVVQPWKLITNLYAHGLSPHGYVNSFVDRVFFAGFLASIPLVYRKVSRPLFLFYLAMGMQPLLGSYMSYTRYVMPAFPLYIAWASYLQDRPRLMWRIAGSMVTLQIALLALHTTNHWVA